MPTYVYACTECDHRFEAQQAFTDDALTDCPNCGGKLRKVFNSVGIVFKGSGFYRNDSRSNGKAAEPVGASNGSDSSKPSTSSDGGGSKDSASSNGTSTPATPAKTASGASSSGSSSTSSSSSSPSASSGSAA